MLAFSIEIHWGLRCWKTWCYEVRPAVDSNDLVNKTTLLTERRICKLAIINSDALVAEPVRC